MYLIPEGSVSGQKDRLIESNDQRVTVTRRNKFLQMTSIRDNVKVILHFQLYASFKN